MSKLLTYASSLALLGALASTASACAFSTNLLSWVTDTRRCSASYSGNGNGSSWQDRTTAFDAYQGGADILVTNGIETWSSHCAQTSHMDGYSAAFQASGDAVILAGVVSNPLVAQAQSKLDLWFTITEPVEYVLRGEVNESSHADSLATVRIADINGVNLQHVVSVPDTSRTFDLVGRLEPGTYRLYAEATGKCRTLTGQVVALGHAGCTVDFSVSPAQDAPAPRPTMTSSTDAPPPRH